MTDLEEGSSPSSLATLVVTVAACARGSRGLGRRSSGTGGGSIVTVAITITIAVGVTAVSDLEL